MRATAPATQRSRDSLPARLRRWSAWLLAASLLATPLPAAAAGERVAVKLLELLLARAGRARSEAVVAAERLLANGQDDLARPYLKALAQPHVDDGDAVVSQYARALQREADALAHVDGARLPTQPFGNGARITERAAFRLQDDAGSAPVLRALADVRSDLGWIDLVPVEVQRFGDAFTRGFRDQAAAFQSLRGSHDDLLDAWLAVPPERRVFVIGAATDAAEVLRLQARLRSEGREVFFYDFCRSRGRPLCPSSAVGAFFGTSGQTLVMQSAQAATSGYVRLEVAVAQRLQRRRLPFVVLSTDDLKAAGEHGGRTLAHAFVSRAAVASGTDGRDGGRAR